MYRVTRQVEAYISLTSILGVPLACLGSSSPQAGGTPKIDCNGGWESSSHEVDLFGGIPFHHGMHHFKLPAQKGLRLTNSGRHDQTRIHSNKLLKSAHHV